MIRGAALAAAVALPWPDAVEALRRKRGGPDFDCLGPTDRWTPAELIPDTGLVSFSPDGQRLACQTAQGVEVRARGAAAGAGAVVAPPGFTIGTRPWSPDGTVLLAAGTTTAKPGDLFNTAIPAEPALFAVKADGSGQTRLLPDIAGVPRAASFSPDGARVVFTLVDRFVHRMVLADWQAGALTNPRVLLPFDPRQEADAGRVGRGLAWHETAGFSPDGQALMFLSDRASGMLNAGVGRMDLATGKVTRVTRDDGFAEGLVALPDGGTLLYGTTRAREPAFMTLVTAFGMPPYLGFVAGPTLHDLLATQGAAVVGNGDVVACNPSTGLFARLVISRETLAAAAKTGQGEGEHRIRVVSGSPSGLELAVAVSVGGATQTVILRRASAPPVAAPAPTPVPPGASPLTARPVKGGSLPLLSPPAAPIEDLAPIDRKLTDKFGGTATFHAEGTLANGKFSVAFDSYTEDGSVGFEGALSFTTDEKGFSHSADVKRLRGTEDTDERGYYRAELKVGAGGTSGELHSKAPRRGELQAISTGGPLVPQQTWKAGRRKAAGVVGVQGCQKKTKKKRKKRSTKKKR